jgi:C1A family cysteine protease
MATTLTVGDLRKILTANKSTWTLDSRLKDTDPLPTHPLGGDLTKVQKAADVPRVDVKTLLATDTSNSFLRQVRIGNGLLKATSLQPEMVQRMTAPASSPTAEVSAAGATGAAAAPARIPMVAPAGGAGAAPAVDWRNRFGWPWLTKIKDQAQCESCWVFSAVGVVEATARIEHSIWSLRSEGDVHDGLGASCGQTGGPATALDWMKTNGVADPGCWPYETQNLAYKPTADRSGRTVRLDNYVTLSNVDDQKAWIDSNGPLSACFTCYYDFMAYGPNSGVYKCNPSSGVAGGHCIVIVGYDDSKQAWLIRNSWGTGWGMNGYCWFGYNQCDMDTYVKYGVLGSATNPDPWTKRRAHNGNLYESGDGALHRNFEMWSAAPGAAIRHYWRDGSSLNWALAETQANDCASSPAVTGTTYNRNFEMVYRTTSNRLHHRYFDQTSGKWFDGPIFGPANVAGNPGFIQSDFGSLAQPEKVDGPAGNFEVVVLIGGGTLAHWWRDDSVAAMPWAQSATFGSNVKLSGPSLVQRFDRGLDVVCVNNDGSMQRYWRDDAHNKGWAGAEKFASGVNSPPVMIRSQYGETDETVAGNYELCVAVNGSIEHWWTAGDAPGNWQKSATFGTNQAGKNVQQVLGLIESSFSFDLEVVALLSDGSLQHFWRSSGNLQWFPGPVFGSTH